MDFICVVYSYHGKKMRPHLPRSFTLLLLNEPRAWCTRAGLLLESRRLHDLFVVRSSAIRVKSNPEYHRISSFFSACTPIPLKTHLTLLSHASGLAIGACYLNPACQDITGKYYREISHFSIYRLQKKKNKQISHVASFRDAAFEVCSFGSREKVCERFRHSLAALLIDTDGITRSHTNQEHKNQVKRALAIREGTTINFNNVTSRSRVSAMASV